MFSFATGIAVSSSGTVYVADYDNFRVQKFSTDGRFLGQYGGFGSDKGQIRFGRGVSVGPDGRLYVANGNNDRIEVYQA